VLSCSYHGGAGGFLLEIEMKKRPIRIEGDVAYVTLACGAEAIIDAEDAELVGQYNWSLCTGYAATSLYPVGEKRRSIKLHRLVMGEPEGFEVDHKYGIRLDNRKAHLRLATRSDNNHNAKVRRDNTSGRKGVSWHKKVKKWFAQIMYMGKQKHLGYFSDPDAAYEAYCQAALKYHGEFARTE